MTALFSGAIRGATKLGSLVPKGARKLAAKSFEQPALAGATGLFLTGEAAPLGRAANPFVNARGEQTRSLIALQRLSMARQDRQNRLKGAIEENIVRIAATDPHLYQELLHGRRLPKGAVVIGRRPRTDFISEVAFQMATGNMRPLGDSTEDLLASLTSPTE